MTETAYELVALGMRYVFVLLILLTLLRAFLLMWGDRRDYQRTLRQLPDAGLVGEVVDLATGNSQPLPREGLIGSGRSCDIRLPGLHRREAEFIFRRGQGLQLIALHRRRQVLLDSQPLTRDNAYALHGTILELRNYSLRFRLFAGLDLPQRQAPAPVVPSYQAASEQGFEIETINQGLPPAAPPDPSLDMTWQYAPLPPELLLPPPESPLSAPSQRRRRAQRNTEEQT